MATRQIEIKITGDRSRYVETVDKLIYLNDRYENKINELEELKEWVTEISQKERVELYKFLNTVFQCRM